MRVLFDRNNVYGSIHLKWLDASRRRISLTAPVTIHNDGPFLVYRNLSRSLFLRSVVRDPSMTCIRSRTRSHSCRALFIPYDGYRPTKDWRKNTKL
ncbi:hypothetical protein M408DRAFT_91988 [Serendipita vermifera MAFF 305830]|uniref:Uncharacterized protein n=1 Tax=Serendipita vermifera MAFF 305830 TaxID=933852 RepID=A0A0C2X826_SERVB|nr:hypothetical protein M408DRAFT_91988 [Serendipita vermifera MAFF 305830]